MKNALEKFNFIQKFPFWFKISCDHNHTTMSAAHQQFRDVSTETKDTFTELFEDDLTAAAAWEEHRRRVREANPQTWPTLFGDRSSCPDYFWAFHFYRQWILGKLGSRDGLDVVEKLEQFVHETNEKWKAENPLEHGDYIKIGQSPDGEMVIALCDPFMHRVHKIIPQSGDLLFMDATSNLDRSDSKLFHMMTPSSIG